MPAAQLSIGDSKTAILAQAVYFYFGEPGQYYVALTLMSQNGLLLQRHTGKHPGRY